jgi:signal transduction histidine kinase
VGLYISKLMVEGMGGNIKLDSSIEEVGSVFSFTLPAA